MLEVVALGGLGEFGMNMLALTWGQTTIVVDAGVMFPDADLPGVDRIIPDLTYLRQQTHVAALVLTHGHEVDRHVLRVSNRIGIAESDDPEEVEAQLCEALPPSRWTKTSDTLILHGRRICKPKPLCDQCAVRDDCDYYNAAARPALAASSGGRDRPLRDVAPRGDKRRRARQ